MSIEPSHQSESRAIPSADAIRRDGASLDGLPGAFSARRLSIALCLDQPLCLDAWQVVLINALLAESGCELVAVVVCDPATRTIAAPLSARIVLSLDRKLFGRLQRTSGREGISTDIPVFARGQQVPASKAPFDVLLDLRERLAGETAITANASEHWTFSFLGDADGAFKSVPHAEAKHAGTFPLSLQISSREGGPIREVRAVCNAKASAVRNLEQAQQAAIGLVLREVRRRLLGLPIEADSEAPAPAGGTGAPQAQGAIAHFLQLACWGVGRLGVEAGDRLNLLPPQFRTLVAPGNPITFSPRSGRGIAEPKNGFVADPFLHRHASGLHIFCEVFDHATRRGHIAVSRLEGTDWSAPVPVINSDTHASFPFIFDWRGETWMIPESVVRNRIEVWRCRRYPDDWDLHATALEGASPVDTTLFPANDSWWLLTSLGQPPLYDHCTELYAFEVSGPDLSSIRPHPLNPIVSDARFARNAGRPFLHDGRLFRPSQSNRFGIYGFGLNIMEVTALSGTSYREQQVRFLPGLHHVDACEGQVVFDVRRGTTDYPSRAKHGKYNR